MVALNRRATVASLAAITTVTRTLSIAPLSVSIIWLSLMAARTRHWHTVARSIAVGTCNRHTLSLTHSMPTGTHRRHRTTVSCKTLASRYHCRATCAHSMVTVTCYRASHYMDNSWTLSLAAVASSYRLVLLLVL